MGVFLFDFPFFSGVDAQNAEQPAVTGHGSAIPKREQSETFPDNAH